MLAPVNKQLTLFVGVRSSVGTVGPQGPQGVPGSNGTNGVDFPVKTVITKVDDYSSDNSDFNGNIFLKMSKSTPMNYTIQSGHTNIEPVQLFQYGVGQVSVVAGSGVTLRHANGLKTRTRYSGISIIPIDFNEYLVTGDTIP